MNLIKTSILTGISTIIKMISSFVINKVIAMYVGPSGLAIIGQLQNFNSIITTFANGAITGGITKYTAEFRDNDDIKSKFFSTAVVISLTCSFIIGVFLNIFSSDLSMWVLKSNKYSSVFVIFGFTVVLFALNTLLMAILNGQKEIKKYILVGIVGSLFSLLFTSALIINLGLIGALYALVVDQSIIFFVTFILVIKSSWFKFKFFKRGADKESLIKLSGYSLMAITSAVTVPISHVLVRNYIGETLGWDKAGYWQGIWYISSMYLMVVTSSLGVYYLPRLSEIKDNIELKKEILNGYKIIIPIVVIMSLTIFILRELAIKIAFNESFMPMKELFKWQLIGDVIKITSWLLSYLMLAKAMTKIFIYTEVLFNFSFVALAVIFINNYGVIGVTYAFALNYFFYLIIMIFMFRSKF
jgi:PST family polysaccharide transporter